MLKVRDYQQNDVITADRVKLVVMLYEGAINFLEIAKKKLLSGDLAGKGAYITKATAIISELLCSLDMEAGGEIARNLYRLYHFMLKELTEASARDDAKPIDVTISLLKELKKGWEEIARRSINIPGKEGGKEASARV